MSDRHASHLDALRARHGISPDPLVREEQTAERGERLLALLESPVWQKDVYPLLSALYRGYLGVAMGAARTGQASPALTGCLALEDFAKQLDRRIDLGEAAERRIVSRHFRTEETRVS